jgi:hypothetical protein
MIQAAAAALPPAEDAHPLLKYLRKKISNTSNPDLRRRELNELETDLDGFSDHPDFVALKGLENQYDPDTLEKFVSHDFVVKLLGRMFGEVKNNGLESDECWMALAQGVTDVKDAHLPDTPIGSRQRLNAMGTHMRRMLSPGDTQYVSLFEVFFQLKCFAVSAEVAVDAHLLPLPEQRRLIKFQNQTTRTAYQPALGRLSVDPSGDHLRMEMMDYLLFMFFRYGVAPKAERSDQRFYDPRASRGVTKGPGQKSFSWEVAGVAALTDGNPYCYLLYQVTD